MAVCTAGELLSALTCHCLIHNLFGTTQKPCRHVLRPVKWPSEALHLPAKDAFLISALLSCLLTLALQTLSKKPHCFWHLDFILAVTMGKPFRNTAKAIC
jgi:hypothetical protein